MRGVGGPDISFPRGRVRETGQDEGAPVRGDAFRRAEKGDTFLKLFPWLSVDHFSKSRRRKPVAVLKLKQLRTCLFIPNNC